jgi:hypothetical protein
MVMASVQTKLEQSMGMKNKDCDIFPATFQGALKE